MVNKELGGNITREPGPLPGIGTKIVSFLDPDGWKTVSDLRNRWWIWSGPVVVDHLDSVLDFAKKVCVWWLTIIGSGRQQRLHEGTRGEITGLKLNHKNMWFFNEIKEDKWFSVCNVLCACSPYVFESIKKNFERKNMHYSYYQMTHIHRSNAKHNEKSTTKVSTRKLYQNSTKIKHYFFFLWFAILIKKY